jgi:F0F1-type ATP synthase delta subunit
MSIKKIKELAKISYEDSDLSDKIVDKISSKLTRSDLKKYIREIKITEKKKNVIVTIPTLPNKEDQKKLQSLFPKKKIIYIIDPSLLIGLRVEDNDLISEISLRENFQELINHVTQFYD